MKLKLLCAFSLMFALQACSGGGGSNTDSGGNKGAGSDRGAGGNTGAGNANVGTSSDSPAIADAKAKCANTPPNPGTDIRYVYSQTINGQSCTTGCQIFTSIEAACSGLLNDQLNNNCAKDSRDQTYHESCLNH